MDKMLTIDETAQLLDVSKDTVRRRIRKGELIAQKHMGIYGQQWLLPASQFERKSVVIQETEVVPLTRHLSVPDLQAAIRAAISDTVSTAVREELEELKQQLVTASNQIEKQRYIIEEQQRALIALGQVTEEVGKNAFIHSRIVENKLKEILHRKQTPWYKRLFKD